MRGTSIFINRGIIRPILLAGVERKVAVLYTTLCICFTMSTNYQLPEVLIGPLLFIVLHVFFIQISNRDPQIVELYARHNRFRQGYYPARTGVMAGIERVRPTLIVNKRV